jgi:hypothetical protein
MLVETILSILTVDFKKPRIAVGITSKRESVSQWLCLISLVQWNDLSVSQNGFVPFSIAQFSL